MPRKAKTDMTDTTEAPPATAPTPAAPAPQVIVVQAPTPQPVNVSAGIYLSEPGSRITLSNGTVVESY